MQISKLNKKMKIEIINTLFDAEVSIASMWENTNNIPTEIDDMLTSLRVLMNDVKNINNEKGVK